MKQSEELKYVSKSTKDKEQQQIEVWLKRLGPSIRVSKIPGDASSRRYYRVKSRRSSFIVMKMNAFNDVEKNLPFLQVQGLLEKLGVNVPKVVDYNSKMGMILLSDLGDQTLLKRLELVSKKRDQLVWFKRAIDLVLNMQVLATENPAPINAYELYFDEDKLMWEVRFTLAHFYNGILAPKISARDIKLVENYFKIICKILAGQNWYFTHRDYHCRNIMVQNEQLYMIDFQDARLGCAQYDLASLLRDSYYQLEEDVVYELVNYYMRSKEKLEGVKINHKEFIRVFDLMSIQRNFKAIGSFASFFGTRNDARYLKFIGNTFENIRRNLLKYPDFEDLRQLLFKYYYF